MKVKCVVLEAKAPKSFKTDEGKTVEYRSALVRVNDTVVRFKVSVGVDLSEYVDQEVVLVVDIVAGANMAATCKVTGVE